MTPGYQIPWILFIFILYYPTSVQFWTLLENLPFLSATVPLAPLPCLASAPIHVVLDTHMGVQPADSMQRVAFVESNDEDAVLRMTRTASLLVYAKLCSKRSGPCLLACRVCGTALEG